MVDWSAEVAGSLRITAKGLRGNPSSWLYSTTIQKAMQMKAFRRLLAVIGLALMGFLIYKEGLKKEKELKLILLLHSLASLLRTFE